MKNKLRVDRKLRQKRPLQGGKKKKQQKKAKHVPKYFADYDENKHMLK